MSVTTCGDWSEVWSSFDQRREAKGEVSAANEGADEAGEPDMFGERGSVAED